VTMRFNMTAAQQDLGSGWRTPSIPKPLILMDNILGSDGYYLVNLPAALPAVIQPARF